MKKIDFTDNQNKPENEPGNTSKFKFFTEQFADVKILRYQVPGFEQLTLKQKELVYYLSQAALAGRDIIYDQNGKYNLAIRRTLEHILITFTGDRTTPDFEKFLVYTKRVWFSNGIYHTYASDKFVPGFSVEYFKELILKSQPEALPLKPLQNLEDFINMLIPAMFDPSFLPKKVNLDSSTDMVKTSAVNFYEEVDEKEVQDFYKTKVQPDEERPLSYGLNSKLVKENGQLKEKIYKLDGLYGAAIKEIVKWLEKALHVAENDNQKTYIRKLIAYYETGDLKTWDEYNIAWLNDTESLTDFINGFIETYEDPLGVKATWESVVNFKDTEATRRTEIISAHAQWFEDNSPVDTRFKKKQVKGVSAKVITVAQLGGDCHPSTPIGINLPNADWIRKEHGSKSVTIENITYAYDEAAKGNGFLEEFSFDAEEVALIEKYGYLTGNLHTDLHECLGHGSGQLLPGVSSEALKNYQSTLEEARADLFALFYMADPKMVELGLIPTLEASKAEYISYIRNGLMTQLTRVELGKNIEESHMRNRQLIAKWCYEKGAEDNVIEKLQQNGKTYFRINKVEKLRQLFGELLKEVQRIKSEGDYEAGKALVENYAVKVDYDLHKEVKERYARLNLAPYSGFINPEFELVTHSGYLEDIRIHYPDNFAEQMLKYAREHSFLPTYN